VDNAVCGLQIVVDDLDAAASAFSSFLGPARREGSSCGTTASYDVQGLGTLQLVRPATTPTDALASALAERLRLAGDGIASIDLVVGRPAQRKQRLEAAGVALVDSGDPTVLMTDARSTHGLVVRLHTAGTAPGATDRVVGEAAPLNRAYVVYCAVRDLEAATATFRAIFDEAGIPMAQGMASPELAAVHFPLVGLYALGVISPVAPPQAADARRFASYLDANGDGGALLGFLVDDLDATQDALRSLGVEFEFARPKVHALGRITWTKPVHGVTLALSQHDDGSYARWRAQEK
jgi:hypothetical protein